MVCATLPATAGMAQSGDAEWPTIVARTIDAFETEALATENLVPFLMPFEHPDVSREAATYLGVAVDTYRVRALTGYRQVREISEIRGWHVLRGARVTGRSGAMDWASVPYSLTLSIDGDPDLRISCNRLFIFRVDGVLYLANLTNRRSDELFRKALPGLVDALDRTPPDCQAISEIAPAYSAAGSAFT